tara:strand:- start:17062 stop:17952 length:891 start_codon:yes stop_codon:yes gene_type:complete
METEKEINLGQLFKIILIYWKIILGSFATFSIISIIFSLTLYNEYRAGTSLVPNNIIYSSGSNTNSPLSGLASIAGIGPSSSSSNEVIIAKEIMQSQEFINNFVRNNNLLVHIMGVKGWDNEANKMVINSRVYDEKNKIWKKGEPSDFAVYEEFSNRLSVGEDKKTSIVSVSIEYYSPVLAQKWVDMYVKEINEQMRQRKLKLTYKNLENLESAIQKPTSQITSQSLSRLIYEQQRMKMLAEATSEYVFETISPPVLPEKKSKPVRSIIVIIFAFSGAFLAIMYALIREIYILNTR